MKRYSSGEQKVHRGAVFDNMEQRDVAWVVLPIGAAPSAIEECVCDLVDAMNRRWDAFCYGPSEE